MAIWNRTPAHFRQPSGHRPRWDAALGELDPKRGDGMSRLAKGHDETVVLLHSSASSSAQWRSLTRALQPHRCVFAPDLPGYGRSEQRSGPGLPGLADAAAMIGTVLGGSAERIHLVGHSYGAAVALRFAADHPERLLSLTLIEP